MMFFILAGFMTAGTAVWLADPLMRQGRRNDGRVLLVLLPCFSLALYLVLGSPDLPDRPVPAASAAQTAAISGLLLAQKPLAALRENPGDIGALLVLGDLNARSGKKGEAAKFYARAVKAAKAQADPRLEFAREKLKALR